MLQLRRLEACREELKLLGADFVVHIKHYALAKGWNVELIDLCAHASRQGWRTTDTQLLAILSE